MSLSSHTAALHPSLDSHLFLLGRSTITGNCIFLVAELSHECSYHSRQFAYLSKFESQPVPFSVNVLERCHECTDCGPRRHRIRRFMKVDRSGVPWLSHLGWEKGDDAVGSSYRFFLRAAHFDFGIGERIWCLNV